MKKPLSKRAPRRRMTTRRRIPRTIRTNKGPENTCKIMETLPKLTLQANGAYQFQLAGILGQRAVAIAQQYGLYRVSKVSFRYKPLSDTFVSNPAFIGGNGAVSVPYLLWKMNRYADQPLGVTADNLRAMGAKPIRLDDKTYLHSYKPNIILDTAVATGSQSGQVKMTPWLNTDADPMTPGFATSTTYHYGHLFYIQAQMAGTGADPIAELEITVQYEFKNPRIKWGATDPAEQVKPTVTLGLPDSLRV